jgi:DNA-binding GntR family transcriptional regulator
MSASTTAYTFTKQQILDGTFAGGELISEGEVADQLSLSRTPVREAFLLLESEGLLRLYPKRGALVVPVSAAEVTDVMETRELVESFAVERASRVGAELLAPLDASISAQQTLLDEGDLAGFIEADREFHRVFVEAAGNAILLQLYDSLRDRQARMGLAAIARTDEHLRLDDHRALAAAVTSGRAVDAVWVLKKHLEGTLRLLREQPRR